jgi:enoyl-[acyl-carrier-protein] reductase (NADH)
VFRAPGPNVALILVATGSRRPITAEDCADAAVYLVSDRAANVTGVLLPVDGGYVAR